MSRVRRVAKDVVMTGCRLLAPGVAPCGLILLYHSVGSPWGVDPGALRHQLTELAERYDVILLQDLPRRLVAAGGRRPPACVTFDDGYRDNAEVAGSILADLGLVATFFVATSFVGGSFTNSYGGWPMMDERQVVALAGAGHEIGVHTVSHPQLTELAPGDVLREVAESKATIEAWTGTAAQSFAYPKGRWNAMVREVVKTAGFRVACTTAEGHLSKRSDLLALPRVSVLRGTSRAQYRARLCRGFALYERVVSR